MKIGINTRLYEKKMTGIGRIIGGLYSELADQKRGLECIFFQTSSEKQLGHTVVKKTPLGVVGDFVFDSFLVNLLAAKHKIQVFHGPAHVTPFFKLPGVKYVVTIHDLSFLVYPEHTPFLFRNYYHLAVGWSLKLADMVVTDSENTKKDVIKHYKVSAAKIQVIYPGLEKSFFRPVTAKKKKYLFTVSTHPKRKNIACLVEVLAGTRELAGYELVIAGLIPEQQVKALKARARELGVESRVRIEGYVAESRLRELYREAALFVFPSQYEGFGFPVLEAMASGSLVVAAKNSSLTELFPDQRFLVDPLTIGELSRKAVWALSLGDAEKKKIIEKQRDFSGRFTWKKAADEYAEVFSRVSEK